jgi:Putative peptidoglycan binding domain
MVVLHAGSKGNLVKRLKAFLNVVVLPSPDLDTSNSRFDSATATAVNNFKRTHGLPADGKVDAATWAEIGAAWGHLMFRERRMLEDQLHMCLSAQDAASVPGWMWTLARSHPYADGPVDINREAFFKAYIQHFGSLSMSQISGLNQLLDFLDYDNRITDLRWAAYILATVKLECADTWQPIEEYGKGHGHTYGNPVTITASDGKTYTNRYYGRGYVQLTWSSNYKSTSSGIGLGEDLWIHPAKALEPDTAYKIITYGMLTGSSFANHHKLSDYLSGTKTDYLHARRMVNGMSGAGKVAGYAKTFEAILKASIPVPPVAPMCTMGLL